MNFQDLSPYINRIDLIRESAAQLIKDFEMFGLEIKFSGNAYEAYEELFDQVVPHMDQLINSNRSKFLGILYRIDISDEQVKKAVDNNSSEPFSHIITDLIIRRELQKVVIRNHYKKP
ncbi:MAG: hypothetical protein M3R27_03145 [Bacteroidota bacterium]|nr:hypothetical protein [Bacteroidota bacterium]